MFFALLLVTVQTTTSPATPAASASPSPAASAEPTPSPTPTPGFSVHGSGANVFIDQATEGRGQVPPEGRAFAAGAPNAPMSPFDWFGTQPLVPGVAGEIQYFFTTTYRSPNVTASADFVTSGLAGDITNGIYWGEPLLGPLDPHEGRSSIPWKIVYPTHAGTDDVLAGQIVVPYDVSLKSNDGSWGLAGGFVSPANYDGFVFQPPGFAGWTPSLDLQTFESVAPAIPDEKDWSHQASALPLLGADVTATVGNLSLEATDGLLPAPTGTSARLTGWNAVLDRGDLGRYSLDAIHLDTSGDALSVPALYGADPRVHPGAQGDLATSNLGDQHQTIAGGRALFHPFGKWDTLIELGRAWYDAGIVARPGSSRPGNYQHYALARTFSKKDDIGLEFYRFDPQYATAILPYGISENLWGIAWAYPGPWLKGTYQLVNDNVAGANRMGLRAHADYATGKFDFRAAYYAYRQVLPSTWDNLTATGFVEVDYLVLAKGDNSLGQTHGAIAFAGWRAGKDRVGIDFARDTQYRSYTVSPGDYVNMRYDQIVVTERHHFTKRLNSVIGYGRYSADGLWTTTPVDGIYGLGFAGVEYGFAEGQQVLVELRRYGIVGLPSIPGGPPPTLRGTGFIVDHHIAF